MAIALNLLLVRAPEMAIILLLLFWWCVTPALAVDNPFTSEKFGYIDRTGKLVIEDEYSSANSFSEGIAFVGKGTKLAFIDINGKKLFEYEEVSDVAAPPGRFCEGLSSRWTPNGTGFVDRTGQFAIQQKFSMATDFAQGLAAVADKDGKWGYIDRSGTFVIQPQFDACLEFSEGLAAVRVGSRWGFIERTGAFRIRPQYEFVDSFKEGLAPVYRHRTYSYIDVIGNVALEGPYYSASTFQDGIAVVEPNSISDAKSLRRYIDRTGKPLDLKTSQDESCGEGMLPFTKNGLVGFANIIGQEVIAPQYQATGGFSDGLAAVKLHGKWGYVNGSGQIVIPPTFDAAYPFSCGRALVRLKESLPVTGPRLM